MQLNLKIFAAFYFKRKGRLFKYVKQRGKMRLLSCLRHTFVLNTTKNMILVAQLALTVRKNLYG